MDSAWLIARARKRAGLSQRLLAKRAGTSHSTLAAYETGAKSPNFSTVVRVLEAAGFSVEVRLRAADPFEDRRRRGGELEDVLALAEAFPAEHEAELAYPPFRGAVA